uniref:AIG1-type G domain-containing protein n=1 Tax=Pygocentrus nattereri TaxID=42514 RepID=A0A3B4ED54_PYGNA
METNKIAGTQVTVVDTPSWNWVPAEDTSDELKQELKRSVEMLGDGPHAFLLVYPLGAPFVKRHKIAVQEHLELLGSDVWDHTMVLFSRGDWLGKKTIEEHVEGVKEDLKWLVEQCKDRYHVLNNKVRSNEMQVIELLEKIKRMIQKKRKWSKTEPPETEKRQTDRQTDRHLLFLLGGRGCWSLGRIHLGQVSSPSQGTERNIVVNLSLNKLFQSQISFVFCSITEHLSVHTV